MSYNTKTSLSIGSKRALRQLIYYDLFNYPLTRDELFLDLDLQTEIQYLVDEGKIHQFEQFYSISDDKQNVEKRLKGNELCEKLFSKAKARANFIYQFPFVRGVYISGSMSKGFMSPDGDVDFFVITEPGKLWVSRTLLILYKKIFLGNSRKFFCMNYFIDSNHLEIEEQNIFTATELITLIPVCVNGLNENFVNSNKWVKSFYPKGKFKERLVQRSDKGLFWRIFESTLNNSFGSLLDRFFMKITLGVWRKKFGNFEPKDFNLALKSRRYVSKHHPQNFQKKVLTRYEDNISLYERKNGVDLSI